MEINIVNNGYPDQDKEEVGVVEQNVTFIQHSDTCDDSDRVQYLDFKTVGVDFDPKDNTDSFFRISTGDPFAYDEGKTDCSQFWSCNGPEELVRLFNEAARRFGMSCRWKVEKYHVQPITNNIDEKVITDEELEQIQTEYDTEFQRRVTAKQEHQLRIEALQKNMGIK